MQARNHRYRIFLHGKMRDVQAVFWKAPELVEVSEVRYLNDDGEVEAVPRSHGPLMLMQSTGFKDSAGNLIYEGDVVQVEYQYGAASCVVEWCPIKCDLVLKPISGDRPKHRPHFRLSGKKSVIISGNVYEPTFRSDRFIKE